MAVRSQQPGRAEWDRGRPPLTGPSSPPVTVQGLREVRDEASRRFHTGPHVSKSRWPTVTGETAAGAFERG